MSFRLRVVSYIEKTVLAKRNDTFQSTSNKPRRFFKKSRRRNRSEERFNCSCFYLLSASPFFFFSKWCSTDKTCFLVRCFSSVSTFIHSLDRSSNQHLPSQAMFVSLLKQLACYTKDGGKKEKCCNAWINCRFFQKTQCYSI